MYGTAGLAALAAVLLLLVPVIVWRPRAEWVAAAVLLAVFAPVQVWGWRRDRRP